MFLLLTLIYCYTGGGAPFSYYPREWKVGRMDDMLGFSKSSEKRCGRRAAPRRVCITVYVQIDFEQVIKVIPFICVSNGSTTEHSWGLLLRSTNSSTFLITYYGNTETGLFIIRQCKRWKKGLSSEILH